MHEEDTRHAWNDSYLGCASGAPKQAPQGCLGLLHWILLPCYFLARTPTLTNAVEGRVHRSKRIRSLDQTYKLSSAARHG